MSPEKTKKLVEAFPLLYRDYTASKSKSLMSFGFAYSNGWFQLTWDLSKKLEAYIQEFLAKYGLTEKDDYPRAFQCKEKFGGLRFYLTHNGPEDWSGRKGMTQAIREAEELAERTCEFCGAEGHNAPTNGWWLTLCNICREKREKSREYHGQTTS